MDLCFALMAVRWDLLLTKYNANSADASARREISARLLNSRWSLLCGTPSTLTTTWINRLIGRLAARAELPCFHLWLQRLTCTRGFHHIKDRFNAGFNGLWIKPE